MPKMRGYHMTDGSMRAHSGKDAPLQQGLTSNPGAKKGTAPDGTFKGAGANVRETRLANRSMGGGRKGKRRRMSY